MVEDKCLSKPTEVLIFPYSGGVNCWSDYK
jgi:hypothetical protein